jgi:hypothetical protein
MHPVLDLGTLDMQRQPFSGQVRRKWRSTCAVDVDMRELAQKPSDRIGEGPAGNPPRRITKGSRAVAAKGRRA